MFVVAHKEQVPLATTETVAVLAAQGCQAVVPAFVQLVCLASIQGTTRSESKESAVPSVAVVQRSVVLDNGSVELGLVPVDCLRDVAHVPQSVQDQ